MSPPRRRPVPLSRLRDARGSVIVIVAVIMTVCLGMAALAVDLGSLYQQQSLAQSAADAAALAGAHDLPTTSTASATANTYANVDLPGEQTPSVTFPTPTQIKVTLAKTAPSLFSQIFGISSENVGATAVASMKPAANCASAGSSCYAIFAMDSTCSGSGHGVTVTAGAVNVTGGILTNSNFSDSAGSGSFGPTIYGPSASGCTATGPSFTSLASETSTVNSWPIDFSLDFPSCSGAACTGPSSTPVYCTQVSTASTWSITPASGNIYCAVGSGTASDPRTWNGAISITPNGVQASYVGGSVSITAGGSSLTACGYSSSGYQSSGCTASGHSAAPAPISTNYPLFYVTGASATAINLSAGGTAFTGDMFAPNGTIAVTAGSGSLTTFVEAKDVNIGAGAFTGDGPSDSSGTAALASSVALLQ